MRHGYHGNGALSKFYTVLTLLGNGNKAILATVAFNSIDMYKNAIHAIVHISLYTCRNTELYN